MSELLNDFFYNTNEVSEQLINLLSQKEIVVTLTSVMLDCHLFNLPTLCQHTKKYMKRFLSQKKLGGGVWAGEKGRKEKQLHS